MNAEDNSITRCCIENWKRHLLDLTGRNRALYYRPARTSLTIHSSPEAVWKTLVEGGSIELDKETLLPPTVQPEDEARLEEDTQRRIKGISEIARVFLDEQGVHVTHAVFGWLQWVDESRPLRPGEESITLRSGKKARLVRSPLLFVPVTIERKRNGARAVLERNAAIESNITLEYAMAELLRINVQFDPEAELDPDLVIKTWQQAIQGREYWEVKSDPQVVIDTFSFKKIALLRELELSRERVGKQPVLRALCGDAQALMEAPAVPSFEPLDEVVSADGSSLVVPADASQLKAILAANRGVNLVIQGPPGTGKSQTITNLISTMVASGKRVLFVAEKRQARDVVVENLTRAGLSEVVLHITEEVLGRRSRAGSKQDIADQLGEVLRLGPGAYQIEGEPQREYEQLKSELNSYARNLHNPLGLSAQSTPFHCLEAWAVCQKEDCVGFGHELQLPSIREIDDSWRRRALELASQVDDLGESTLTLANSPWLESALERLDPATEQDLETSLSMLVHAQETLDHAVEFHCVSNPIRDNGWTFEDANQLLQVVSTVAGHHAARQRMFGFLLPSFWSTRKLFQEFEKAGGRGAEHAGPTADQLRQHIQQVHDAQGSLGRAFPVSSSVQSITDLATCASRLLESMPSARHAIAVKVRCEAARGMGMADTLVSLVRVRQPGQQVRRLLELALARRWAQEAMASHPSFQLEGPARARLVESLKSADRQAALAARAAALNAVAPHRPGNMDVAPRGTELAVLRSQVNAKRRKSLLWLFSNAPNLIQQIKPCIVASPLAVAQFLRADPYQFDVVIFDEASQIPTADAVVPISRARQVIVVGDSQQMPPTSFFDRMAPQEDDPDEVVYESILSECETLLPSRPLLWHYRSQDERLIAFSNRNFYKGELLTFPSAWHEHPEMGVKLCYLPDAIYGRSGSRANPDEAQKVVEILKQELEAHPEHEVGVTAMSVAQSVEIQNRIEAAALGSSALRVWLDQGGRARNLETVQGDEFDVSILSFGYGKDAAGNLQLNFGPLSREEGYKRLNVAITRARKKTVVVSSIHAADIPPGRVSAGGQLVRQYLDYAERGPVVLAGAVRAGNIDVYDSPFEEEVAREIRALGWLVDTQVGVGKLRVDIGIQDLEHPGLYLAGVECDGATYHSAETARDRDIGRQEVLERLGWKIYRIWSPDWFRDRRRVLNDLQNYLDALLADGKRTGTDSAKTGSAVQHTLTGQNQALDLKPLEPGFRPGTVPYRVEGPAPFPTGYDPQAWRQWLVEKVKVEGPWQLDELVSMARHHPDGLTRPYLHRLLQEAISEGQLVVREFRVWHPQTEPQLVPVKVNRNSIRRDFNCYSDLELLRALELACAGVGSAYGGELPTVTARLLGYPRTTRAIKQRLESLIGKAVSEGYLVNEGDSYRAGSPSGTD